MTQLATKFRTSKALQMIFRPSGYPALGSENCVNFGLDLGLNFREKTAVMCVNFGLDLRKKHRVICVNFGVNQMLRQVRT